jgi:MFS family permease
MFASDDHGRARTIGLAVACLGMAMTFLNITATTSVLAPIQRDLHASSTAFVWIAGTYAMVVASLVLSAGTLGDLVGRRRAFMAGAVAMGAGSLTTALADSATMVIAGEALMGLGGALVLPNSLAIVTHAFTDPHQRTTAVGAWTAVSGLALAIGPIVAGVLLASFSWHAVFGANVALAAVVLVLAPRYVEDSRLAGRRLDVPGLALAAVAIGALNYAVITGGDAGFGDGKVVGAFAIAVIAGVLFVSVELRRRSPMLKLELFGGGSFTVANVVGFVGQFGFVAVALTEVLWFERIEGLSVLATGVRLLPLMVPYVVVSAGAASVARRKGFKVTIVAGLTLLAAAAVLAVAQATGTPYGVIAVMLAIFGTAFGLVLPPTTAAAVISVPHAEGGMASAAVNMFRQVGGALGASITGTILTSGFASRLPDELAGHGVPHAAIPGIANAAGHGASADAAPHALRERIAAAAGDAFAGALHVAVLVPGIAAALAALAAAWWLANRPSAAPAARIAPPAGARVVEAASPTT